MVLDMDETNLTKKIKRFREENNLTQEAVEKAINLPHKAMTHIESGARRVSTLELVKLSELFFVPLSDFLSEDKQEDDLMVILHRILPGLEFEPKIHAQVSKCIQICREGAFLKNLLGFNYQKTTPSYSFPNPKNIQEAKQQGEEVARSARKELELGDAPIRDIAEIISSQGIWTAQTLLPNEMSGLFLNHLKLGLAIIVNASHGRARQCFSYAHEYAHALIDSQRTVTISNSDNAKELVEVRANTFASAFLLPEQGVANLLRDMGKGGSSRIDVAVYNPSTNSAIEAEFRQKATSQLISVQTIARIAYWFGVSYQATVYRLQNLGYFKAKERDELLKREEQGRDYLRVLHLDMDGSVEHSSQNRELKAQIAHLAIEAYQRGEISQGRLLDLSKLLDLSGKELLGLAKG